MPNVNMQPATGACFFEPCLFPNQQLVHKCSICRRFIHILCCDANEIERIDGEDDCRCMRCSQTKPPGKPDIATPKKTGLKKLPGVPVPDPKKKAVDKQPNNAPLPSVPAPDPKKKAVDKQPNNAPRPSVPAPDPKKKAVDKQPNNAPRPRKNVGGKLSDKPAPSPDGTSKRFDSSLDKTGKAVAFNAYHDLIKAQMDKLTESVKSGIICNG